MKIFSLQSKKAILVWSLILGTVINFAFTLALVIDACKSPPGCGSGVACPAVCHDYGKTGAPLKFSTEFENISQIQLFIFNNLFWILVVAVILILLNRFRRKRLSKNSPIPPGSE